MTNIDIKLQNFYQGIGLIYESPIFLLIKNLGNMKHGISKFSEVIFKGFIFLLKFIGECPLFANECNDLIQQRMCYKQTNSGSANQKFTIQFWLIYFHETIKMYKHYFDAGISDSKRFNFFFGHKNSLNGLIFRQVFQFLLQV